MTLSQQLGYQKGVAKALNALGDIAYHKKEYDKAIDFYQESNELVRSIDNVPILSSGLVELGFAYAKTNAIDLAEACLLEAKDLIDSLDKHDLRFQLHLLEVEILGLKGAKKEAMSILERLLTAVNGPEEEADIYYELSKLEPKGNIHRRKAFDLYQSLYHTIPKFLFRQRIQELREP